MAAAVPTLAQILALLNPDFVVVDCEERFNAAHAVSLAAGHWDALLDLQYRKFCGGCTFTAGAGAVFFSVLPSVFAVWKLVPLAFTAVLSAVGFRGLWRAATPTAAVLFVAMVSLAPPPWVRLALLAWGNHYEAGLFCLALALLAARGSSLGDRAHAAVGLLVGFAMWFGFSSTYAALGFVLVRALQRRWAALGWLALGALFAPLMWLAQLVSTDQQPFGTIYSKGEAIPSLMRIPGKLRTLLLPQQWAGLFSVNNVNIGVPLGGAGLIAAVVAWAMSARAGVVAWRRDGASRIPLSGVFAGFLTIWLALYLVVAFTLEQRPWPGVPSAAGLRYAAPWMPLLWALIAVQAGRWWTGGRRKLAVALLLPHVLSGLLTKAAVLGGSFPNTFAFGLDAPDHESFRYVNSYALDPRDQETCGGTDPDHVAGHAFALGRHGAQGVLPGLNSFSPLPLDVMAPEDAFYAGVGQAVIDGRDSDAVGGLAVLTDVQDLLATLPPEGVAPAIYEATWWRAFRDRDYGFARGDLFAESTLSRLLRQTTTLSPDLRHAALHSLGRRWGIVHGRWGQPGAVPWPVVIVGPRSAEGLSSFAEGLGTGLGTKWGPGLALPVPEGMPDELVPAYVRGLAEGVDLQWRPGTVTVSRDSSWPDAGADRWWGPVPTMYCPCRATCW